MTAPLPIGMVIHGFCGGIFHNDSDEHKRVEAVGVDWVVLREIEGGALCFVDGPEIHEKLRAEDAEWLADQAGLR